MSSKHWSVGWSYTDTFIFNIHVKVDIVFFVSVAHWIFFFCFYDPLEGNFTQIRNWAIFEFYLFKFYFSKCASKPFVPSLTVFLLCWLEVYNKLLLPISLFLIKTCDQAYIYALDFSFFENRTHCRLDAGCTVKADVLAFCPSVDIADGNTGLQSVLMGFILL